MNNNNFTISEITNLQSRAEVVFDNLLTNLRKVQDSCNNMSTAVASGDSNISSRWTAIANSLVNPINNAQKTFEVLNALMANYVQRTIENEGVTESQLSSVDEDLNEVNAEVGSLVYLESLVVNSLRYNRFF